MKPINTRLLVSVMIIVGGLANLTIRNLFDDYLDRFIGGLRNIDFDHHSMSIGSRGKALCSINSIRVPLLKNGEKLYISLRHASQHTY